MGVGAREGLPAVAWPTYPQLQHLGAVHDPYKRLRRIARDV
jgi:hypothetical protein